MPLPQVLGYDCRLGSLKNVFMGQTFCLENTIGFVFDLKIFECKVLFLLKVYQSKNNSKNFANEPYTDVGHFITYLLVVYSIKI